MAGPCSIESEEQALRIAQGVKAGGATLFRGGAYKPRTSPYSFQGLETEGILDMVKAREATGMPIVSELMSEERIPEFEEYVDVVQIGARNMQNFQLLKAVGKMHKPVLLKRGLCNTNEEWIMSAEYIMAGGNEQVILCERGIRTFEKYTRNTLDLSAVPIVHEKTHLPVIVDPSHATGKANLVEPMMIAAVAAGADGLEVEVHYDPRHAWSDGAQCLTRVLPTSKTLSSARIFLPPSPPPGSSAPKCAPVRIVPSWRVWGAFCPSVLRWTAVRVEAPCAFSSPLPASPGRK